MAVTPFVPFASAMQVNMRFNWAGENVEMVMGFDYANIGFATAAPLVYDVLNLQFWEALRYQLSNTIQSVETYMIDLVSQFGGSATFGPFTDPVGSVVGKSVTNNVAFVVTHATALRGRSYRGRTYVPGLADQSVNNNRLDPAVVTAVVFSFNDMRDGLFDQGINFVVLSRRHLKEWRELGQATPVVISAVKDNVVDSQRGRLPNH